MPVEQVLFAGCLLFWLMIAVIKYRHEGKWPGSRSGALSNAGDYYEIGKGLLNAMLIDPLIITY
jgi:hypothetical protein